jgi:mono/diheme cytochrome c family protein
MKRIRMRFQVATAACGAVALMMMGGCGGGGSSSGVNISAADRKEAHDIFQTRCATCHGQFGRGDGPGAAALNPKPQNYADAAWQQKVTDAEIEKAIVFGGVSVGKSAQMVPNPDLEAKPGVVAVLREKVRSFGEQ